MKTINLEPLCALYGMRLLDDNPLLDGKAFDVKDQLNIVNKTLGVLVENGVYAMAVAMITFRKPKDGGKKILLTLTKLLADPTLKLLPDKQWNLDKDEGIKELLQHIRDDITTDLPRLLLARKVLEGALTFARYHCKAMLAAAQTQGD